MDVLFLDIDGVMNNNAHLVRSRQHSDLEWNPEAVRCVKELTKTLNLKIVISSSWRRNKSIEYFTKIFSVYDFDKTLIVGMTPVHWDEDFSYPRAMEIQEYIDGVKGTDLEVNNFIYLDDDDNDILHLYLYFIKVDSMVGFTEEDKNKAILLFNSYPEVRE